MQTITRLERQKKNKERVNIFLDGVFAFGLHELDAARLKIGQQLSEEDIQALQARDSVTKAMDTAVNFLSYRPRSIQEIRRKLLEKDFSENTAEEVIQRLERMQYVDDRAFARFWIEDRNRNRPRGHQALRFELRQKGIADTIIQELLDDMVDEMEAAYKAAQSRVRRMQGKPQQVFKQKIGAFLQRRGFAYDAIREALDRLLQEIEMEDETFFADANDMN